MLLAKYGANLIWEGEERYSYLFFVVYSHATEMIEFALEEKVYIHQPCFRSTFFHIRR